MAVDHAAIATLAAAQHGAFSHAQAREAGATPSSAVSAGRWLRATRGVFLLAGYPGGVEQRATVAVLARPDGVIGDLTSAHLRGWISSSPHLPTLLVPPSASLRSPVARSRRDDVAPDDRTTVSGIATTTAACTLVHLAGRIGPNRLRSLVDTALHQRATTPAQVLSRLEALPTHRSAHRADLLTALEPWREEIRPGSPAEARLLRLLEAWGYPRPELQIAIVDPSGTVIARVDGGWHQHRIAFEYDGRRFHGPERWAHDAARQAAIEGLGWTILRADAADLRPGERAFRDALSVAWTAASHLPPRCVNDG